MLIYLCSFKAANDLSVSLLRKSEQEMLRILEQFPRSIYQTNRWGQAPLHLAVRLAFGHENIASLRCERKSSRRPWYETSRVRDSVRIR